MKVILASQSPRRVKVMNELGIPFEVVSSDFPEETVVEKDPLKLVEILALEKARVVAANNPDAVVIGADTVIMVAGEITGKPKDLDEARRMLLKGSGGTNRDFTGLAVIYKGKEKSTAVSGSAKMRKYGSEEIEDYFSRINPLDKAGGFAGDPADGGEFLESYSGEPGEELGLPLETLRHFLKEFGVLKV